MIEGGRKGDSLRPLTAAALGEPKARPFNLINWKDLTAKGGDNYINYQQIL